MYSMVFGCDGAATVSNKRVCVCVCFGARIIITLQTVDGIVNFMEILINFVCVCERVCHPNMFEKQSRNRFVACRVWRKRDRVRE